MLTLPLPHHPQRSPLALCLYPLTARSRTLLHLEPLQAVLLVLQVLLALLQVLLVLLLLPPLMPLVPLALQIPLPHLSEAQSSLPPSVLSPSSAPARP
jgi:hypothetical protein